jgi:CDP-paratose 2-epimerase
MFWHYHQKPIPGAVYNAGGGRQNSTSILEAINMANDLMEKKIPNWTKWDKYAVQDTPRIGDHQWYITDFSAFRRDYPEWPGITINLQETISQILDKCIEEKTIAA